MVRAARVITVGAGTDVDRTFADQFGDGTPEMPEDIGLFVAWAP
jgi:hypothetical protein